MSSLLMLGIGLAAIAGAFVLFVIVPRAVLAGFRASLQQRIKRRYPESDRVLRVEYSANSFGVQSLSMSQWRGNGALVLTDTELCFFQIAPEREMWLKLTKITAVRVVQSHLGSSTPSDLLRVEFAGKQGPDAIVYWLPDPSAFKALLESRLEAAAR